MRNALRSRFSYAQLPFPVLPGCDDGRVFHQQQNVYEDGYEQSCAYELPVMSVCKGMAF